VEITETQFIEIVKKAFLHGLACAPFFPEPFGDGEGCFTKEEQIEKINEVAEDCHFCVMP